ncbi:MAG: B12-binding domain-containing radical SAM protein [Pirellulaceae bacterium]|nr:B12-binding domain-containing radical SAM protein [Pirellulaceae bacterium]
MVHCLLVYPEFTLRSFWNFKATCDLQNAKYPATPLGLITVAAMLPKEWDVRLVDCNVESLLDSDLDWADVVLTGGMLPQQISALEIVKRAQERGKPVVVGGPDATSSPHIYQHANHLVLGEAELTLPEWLHDFQLGQARDRYDPGEAKADVTTSPTPRFELLKLDRYLFPGVQFARGCPFNCEFCDIIELFGRVPRLKKPEQLLRELDAIYALGHRGLVDIVDDNFIGNKRDVKKFLPLLIQWQEKHGYPFEFATEASVNLSSDDELLALMQRANFATVFVGIESPDEVTLKQTQKSQNTKRELASSLQKIYSYGMWVSCGYIVGFDGERGSVTEGVTGLISASATPIAMVGLLFALPGTQLTRRLAREGRLHTTFDRVADDGQERGDQCSSGLNFETLRPKLDILRDYRNVIAQIYSPDAYFDRVQRVSVSLNCSQKRLKLKVRHYLRDIRALGRIMWRQGVRASYRRTFWKTLGTLMLKNPKGLRYGINLMAFYLHFGPFSQYLLERVDESIAHEAAKQAATQADTQNAAQAASDERQVLLPLPVIT